MDANESALPMTRQVRGTTRRTRSLPGGVEALPAASDSQRARAIAASGPDGDFEPRERSEVLSAAFNIAIALAMFIIALPIMLLTALLVRLSSRGPVFYTQTRVGIDRRWNRTRALHERRREDLGGTPFTIYKFRSMCVDAEANGQAVWATENDARVTAVGKFIRKTRLDELPQLFNVIRGDMNIVGPRPERPSIFVRLREQITEYPLRQRVKPGITGMAQVYHSYDRSVDDVRRKVHFDLEYMRRQSLVEDIRIMCLTVPVMLFRIGGW
mgnify:CR=1 FL=1